MNEQQILAYAKQKFNDMTFRGEEIQWAVALYNYLDEQSRPQQVRPEPPDRSEPTAEPAAKAVSKG